MRKSSEFHKKMAKILKVVFLNLTVFSVGIVFFLGILFVREHMNHDKELAIGNTIFNEQDIPIATKKAMKKPYNDWYLTSSEKIAALDKNGLSDHYLIQVLNEFMTDDFVLQTKPKSNYETKVRSFFKGELVYEVDYSFDQFSRRVTPFGTDVQESSAFIATFGGSFAFGDGVKSNETLAYYLGKENKFIPYNYGAQGYGPQHMFLQIKGGQLARQVKKGKGLVLYFYMPHHRNRLIGSMKELRWSQGRFPYLDILENGELKFLGNFKQARPFYFKALNFLASLSFIASRIEDLPDPHTDSSTEFLCHVLSETSREVKKQITSGTFAVLIDPNASLKDNLVKDCLEKKNILYFDAREVRGQLPTSLSILAGVEDHYRAEVYRVLSNWLSKSSIVASLKGLSHD